MSQTIEEAVDIAVKQLSKWWMVDDKRDAFEKAARELITRELEQNGKTGYNDLYIDYDPQGLLLDIVHAAGVECRGFGFSAQDLFSVGKSGVRIVVNDSPLNDGVYVKRGYGADWERCHSIGAVR